MSARPASEAARRLIAQIRADITAAPPPASAPPAAPTPYARARAYLRAGLLAPSPLRRARLASCATCPAVRLGPPLDCGHAARACGCVAPDPLRLRLASARCPLDRWPS